MRSAHDTPIVGLIARGLNPAARAAYCSLVKGLGSPDGLLEDPQPTRGIPALFAALCDAGLVERMRRKVEKWQAQGIGLMVWGAPRYPARLAEIFDPPLVLFYRGQEPQRLNEIPCLALVGSRAADPAGCEIARELGQRLAGGGVCVISGLALGIDGAAHRGALGSQSAFPTAAVLGNGLPALHPPSHARLGEEILRRGGLALSQFDPGEKPYPSNFLDRNRVIAGLADGVVVIQAARRSGSLATARFALESGREVMAVPGGVNDPRYEGSNNLIKQGAYLITGAEDIYDILPRLRPAARPADAPPRDEEAALPEAQRRILELLKNQAALRYGELQRSGGLGDDFPRHVLELEIAGKIKRLPGNLLAIAGG